MLDKFQRKYLSDLFADMTAAKTLPEFMIVARDVVALSHQEWVKRSAWPEIQSQLRRFNRKPKKVACVDVSQQLHAAWHTIKDHEKVADEVVDRCLRINDSLKPDEILYAFDAAETHRRKLSEQYKAGREEKPLEFYCAAAVAKAKLGSGVIEFDNQEADDILASLATTGAILGDEVILCTNDRDLWQVLGPRVVMWHKGEFFTRNELKEKHGILPQQAHEWLAMVGKNDIPGLEGVGGVKASKLLQLYGDMFHIIDTGLDGKSEVSADWKEWSTRYWNILPLYKLIKTLEVQYPY